MGSAKPMSQADKFKEAARELGADLPEDAFKRVIRQIGSVRPEKEDAKPKKGRKAAPPARERG